MKRIAMLLALLCALCACGSSQTEAQSAAAQSEGSQSETEQGVNLETTCITVYEFLGDTWDITDPQAIADIAGAADMDQWEAQIALEDQISAAPTYVLDFHNGACVAPLGDGYILLGTGCVHEEDRFGVTDGCQYQVNRAFTDQIEAALGS